MKFLYIGFAIQLLFICSLFSANLLDGVANTGMVELGDIKLATYLAEKKYTGQPFFRNGK